MDPERPRSHSSRGGCSVSVTAAPEAVERWLGDFMLERRLFGGWPADAEVRVAAGKAGFDQGEVDAAVDAAVMLRSAPWIIPTIVHPKLVESGVR